MASLTDSAILEQYKLARDTLVAGINAGSHVVEYQVMSQRKRVTDPLSELKHVERMIQYYEAKVNASTAGQGRARNYTEIKR